MIWTLILGLLVVVSALYYSQTLNSTLHKDKDRNIELEQDHPLLSKNSDFRGYVTSYGDYPSIRTFYHPHAHEQKLQGIADLPLLVFVHGLGGSLVQFAPLLGSLVNIAPCFGIDLPGHGLSEFNPTELNAYSIEASALLIQTAIEKICHQYGQKRIVFVAHSMGCSIVALLSSSTSFPIEIGGIIAICPRATPPTRYESSIGRRLIFIPDFVIDLLRRLDGRGGEESKSVKRFVGQEAGIDLKKLQLKYNRQVKTPVWKRSVIGCLPRYDSNGQPHGGLPGRKVWQEIRNPLLLISGEADHVTRPEEATKIAEFFRNKSEGSSDESRSSNSMIVPVVPNQQASQSSSNGRAEADDQHYGVLPKTHISAPDANNSRIVKTVILPAPAAHALMYSHSTYRTVAGLIEDFLSHYVSHQLELGWQLQHLTTSGKWDVKNLEKWKKVAPVSGPIDHGLFRALKTLREQDEEHTPSVFVKNWKDRIFALIDISHDSPIYDTKALEKGGIQYHKFPTVSKVPPTVVEVSDFIALVERLRQDQEREPKIKGKAIGVHCHYGYNRTGFFIACYLIERRGYQVQDAIDEFAREKPPGIKHDHFIDTLFVRYCVGLKKAPTFDNLAN